MKCKHLIFGILFTLLAFRAEATVLIYKGTVKRTLTGQSQKDKTLVTTYFVLEPFSTQLLRRIQLFRNHGDKTYVVLDFEDIRLVRVEGPNNTTSKDFVDVKTFLGAGEVTHSLFLRGVASFRTVALNATSFIPRMLTGQGRDLVEAPSGALRTEDKIVLSYDTELTVAANDAGGSINTGVNTVIAHIENDLGFQPAP